MNEKPEALLNLKDLNVSYKINGKFYPAVSDINLSMNKGEILAVVGESGCGKSTIANDIMGLQNKRLTKTTGVIDFEGQDLLKMSEKELNKIHGSKLSMIFQDPMSSLNPLKRVRDQIKETLDYHTNLSKEEKNKRVIELLKDVGIENPKRVAADFPHELSGGMRQRIMIAIAIACEPDLIIADEPTTALDVTIQAQILDVLRKIRKEKDSGILLITHDLGVVAQTADKVAVMYAGQIVEKGSVQQIFHNPKHPYTRSLLRSNPTIDNNDDDLYVINGSVPSLQKMPTTGDRFAPRIPWVPKTAHEEHPVMHDLGNGHLVRCTCYQQFTFPDEKDKQKNA